MFAAFADTRQIEMFCLMFSITTRFQPVPLANNLTNFQDVDDDNERDGSQ